MPMSPVDDNYTLKTTQQADMDSVCVCVWGGGEQVYRQAK